MNRKYWVITIAFTLILMGCTPLERTAYNTIVAAKAFLDNEKAAHPECATGSVTTVCTDLAKATSAKDLLIDAVEVYCSSPDFDKNGAACSPLAKGTPASQQAIAKLNAAIVSYNQAATDLKEVIK